MRMRVVLEAFFVLRLLFDVSLRCPRLTLKARLKCAVSRERSDALLAGRTG